jgi:hypothetical protein
MGRRTLDELILTMENDVTAGRLKGLIGMPHTRNSVAVIVNASNKLVPYRLTEDGAATELNDLPDWCKNTYVSNNKRFFTAKRRNDRNGNATRGNGTYGDGKRARRY